mgnify:FL=1|tara:strand:+ start:3138 stop:3521 length:384 start_codon:yes stop_codon:yes gene_type:complete
MDKLLKDRIIKDKDAVMFDIDDTLIFTNGRANKPIINLLHYCSHLGYSIVIITARPDVVWMREFTKWQLKRYNITYDELLFIPAELKGEAKASSGYNYILSVGDMDTDLTNSAFGLKISNGSHTYDT